MACGALVMGRNGWLAAAFLLVAVPVYHVVIRREEALLAGIFGEAYAAYTRDVPRFFPRLRRPRGPPRGIRLASGASHREWRAWVGGVLLTLLLLARWYWMRAGERPGDPSPSAVSSDRLRTLLGRCRARTALFHCLAVARSRSSSTPWSWSACRGGRGLPLVWPRPGRSPWRSRGARCRGRGAALPRGGGAPRPGRRARTAQRRREQPRTGAAWRPRPRPHLPALVGALVGSTAERLAAAAGARLRLVARSRAGALLLAAAAVPLVALALAGGIPGTAVRALVDPRVYWPLGRSVRRRARGRPRRPRLGPRGAGPHGGSRPAACSSATRGRRGRGRGDGARARTASGSGASPRSPGSSAIARSPAAGRGLVPGARRRRPGRRELRGALHLPGLQRPRDAARRRRRRPRGPPGDHGGDRVLVQRRGGEGRARLGTNRVAAGPAGGRRHRAPSTSAGRPPTGSSLRTPAGSATAAARVRDPLPAGRRAAVEVRNPRAKSRATRARRSPCAIAPPMTTASRGSRRRPLRRRRAPLPLALTAGGAQRRRRVRVGPRTARGRARRGVSG